MTSRIRSIGFAAAFVSVFAGATMLYAQTFPSSSPYTECVAPHIRSYEDQVLALQQTYEQQVIQLVRQRADERIVAWTIPERSARSRAVRNAERAYRDNVRVLGRSYNDQHKVLLRQFKEAEDVCDDQFDNDVEDGGGSSSSLSFRSSSFSSRNSVCGNHICEAGEGLYCPPCDSFPCTQSCAIGTCPQDCSSSSSSSRSSSSSSSWIFYPMETILPQQIQSCGCKTVCDPSGSPCMAVCPAEC